MTLDKKIIFESVLDPMRTTRNPEIFDNYDSDTPVMKEDIRKFIINVIETFIKNTEIPNFKATEIFMIGSMLGFQYKDTSDIDIEVQLNIPRSEFRKYRKWSMIPHGVYLPNSQHPVNIFLLFADDPKYDPKNAENMYDLIGNKWIKKVGKTESKEIPYAYIRGISEFLIDGMTLQIERAERDIADLKKYVALDPKTTEISEHEKDEAISNKITDLLVDKDALRLAHRIMFRINNDGFNDAPIAISIDYHYDDNRYSMNNLIYKYIDDFGYYEKLNDLVKNIDSAIALGKSEIKKNQETATTEVETKLEVQKAVQETFMFKDVDGKFYEY